MKSRIILPSQDDNDLWSMKQVQYKRESIAIFSRFFSEIIIHQTGMFVNTRNNKIHHQGYYSLPSRTNRPRTLNYSQPIPTHVQNNKEVHTFAAMIIVSYKLSEKLKFVFVKSGSKCAYYWEDYLQNEYRTSYLILAFTTRMILKAENNSMLKDDNYDCRCHSPQCSMPWSAAPTSRQQYHRAVRVESASEHEHKTLPIRSMPS